MALPVHKQFLTQIEQANRPVIVLRHQATVDDFAAGFAMAHLLSKLQKPFDIVTSGGLVPKSLDFLKTPHEVRGDMPNIRKLTIKIDTTVAQIDELSYDKNDGELLIHLLPKTGSWEEKHVNVATDQYRYDLIIGIGASDYESFGTLFKRYGDFFFETPVINIDHSPENEHFGSINLVDMNAVSCTEVVHDMLKKLDVNFIDEEIATMILTGMIHKTRSFKSTSVSPKTLKTASDLIARGARRDEIVQYLYKTRTVETLRLWGRALARLKVDKTHKLVWTLITRQDFMHAGTDEGSLETIIDELISSSPDAQIAAIFFEDKDRQINTILHAQRPHDAIYLGAPFNAMGTRELATLRVKETDIVKAEKKVITHLRSKLSE